MAKVTRPLTNFGVLEELKRDFVPGAAPLTISGVLGDLKQEFGAAGQAAAAARVAAPGGPRFTPAPPPEGAGRGDIPLGIGRPFSGTIAPTPQDREAAAARAAVSPPRLDEPAGRPLSLEAGLLPDISVRPTFAGPTEAPSPLVGQLQQLPLEQQARLIAAANLPRDVDPTAFTEETAPAERRRFKIEQELTPQIQQRLAEGAAVPFLPTGERPGLLERFGTEAAGSLLDLGPRQALNLFLSEDQKFPSPGEQLPPAEGAGDVAASLLGRGVGLAASFLGPGAIAKGLQLGKIPGAIAAAGQAPRRLGALETLLTTVVNPGLGVSRVAVEAAKRLGLGRPGQYIAGITGFVAGTAPLEIGQPGPEGTETTVLDALGRVLLSPVEFPVEVVESAVRGVRVLGENPTPQGILDAAKVAEPVLLILGLGAAHRQAGRAEAPQRVDVQRIRPSPADTGRGRLLPFDPAAPEQPRPVAPGLREAPQVAAGAPPGISVAETIRVVPEPPQGVPRGGLFPKPTPPQQRQAMRELVAARQRTLEPVAEPPAEIAQPIQPVQPVQPTRPVEPVRPEARVVEGPAEAPRGRAWKVQGVGGEKPKFFRTVDDALNTLYNERRDLEKPTLVNSQGRKLIATGSVLRDPKLREAVPERPTKVVEAEVAPIAFARKEKPIVDITETERIALHVEREAAIDRRIAGPSADPRIRRERKDREDLEKREISDLPRGVGDRPERATGGVDIETVRRDRPELPTAEEARTKPAKPLWQTPREEYFNDPTRVQQDVGGRIRRASLRFVSPGPGGPIFGKMPVAEHVKRGDIIPATFGRAEVTSIGVVGERLDNQQLFDRGKKVHRAAVEEAVRKGRDIPLEVLVDYPDLAKQVAERKVPSAKEVEIERVAPEGEVQEADRADAVERKPLVERPEGEVEAGVARREGEGEEVARAGRIDAELRALEPARQAIKARTMRFQADLKDRVGRDLGVSGETLDLPFKQWEAIRDARKKGNISEAKRLLQSALQQRKGPGEEVTPPEFPKEDPRIADLNRLARENADNPQKLRDIEQRLRGIAASQVIGREAGKPMTVQQESVAKAARFAADRVAKTAAASVAAKEIGRAEKPTEVVGAELVELRAKKFKTRGDEITIGRLQRESKADPAKWKVGQGVGQYVGPATPTKPGSQINRGFRITAVDPTAKTVTIRQVADTGITRTGGDFDRIEDQKVHIAELVRDKKFDAERPGAPIPTPTTEVKVAVAVTQPTESMRAEVHAAIRSAPSFNKLRAAVKRHLHDLYGKTGPLIIQSLRGLKTNPEGYLTEHAMVLNAKSQRARTMRELSRKVIRESGVPTRPPGTFRGESERIAWDKVRVPGQPREGKEITPPVETAAAVTPAIHDVVIDGKTLVEAAEPILRERTRLSDEAQGLAKPPAELGKRLREINREIEALEDKYQAAVAEASAAPAKPFRFPLVAEEKAPRIIEQADIKPNAASTPQGDIYRGTFQGQPKFFVRTGNDPKGFGDSFFETLKEAREESAAFNRSRNALAEQEIKDTEKTAKDARTKADREDLDGFADDKPAVQRQKIVNTLNKSIRSLHHGGKILTRKEYIRDAVENRNAEIVVSSGREEIQVADGRVEKLSGGFQENVEHFIGSTKTEVDFAKHLISRRGTQRVEEVPKGVPEVAAVEPKVQKITKATENSIDRLLVAADRINMTILRGKGIKKSRFESDLATVRTHAAKLDIPVGSVGTFFHTDVYKRVVDAVTLLVAKKFGPHPTARLRELRDKTEVTPVRDPEVDRLTQVADTAKLKWRSQLRLEAQKADVTMPPLASKADTIVELARIITEKIKRPLPPEPPKPKGPSPKDVPPVEPPPIEPLKSLPKGEFIADPVDLEGAPPTVRPAFASIKGRPAPAIIGKPRLTVDKIASSDLGIEDFFKRSDKMGSQKAKLKKALDTVKLGLQERFVTTPAIPRTPETALVRDKIRTMPEEVRAAMGKAETDIAEVLDGKGNRQALDVAGLELLSRKVFTEDMLSGAAKAVEAGQPAESRLPKGVTLAGLKTHKNEVDQLLRDTPSVRDAYLQRQKLWKNVSEDLAKRGVISEENAANPSYVRHFVLDFLQSNLEKTPSGQLKRLQAPFRAYALGRKGTIRDHSTDYLEVEVAALRAIYRDNAIEDIGWNIGEGVAVTEEVAKKSDRRYVQWRYKRGNVMYSAKTVPESAIAKLQNELIRDPEMSTELRIPLESLRDVLVVGAKRKAIWIPEEIATTLDNLPMNRQPGTIVSFTTPITQVWKRWILRVNPIRYNLRNMLGDAERVNAAGRTKAFGFLPAGTAMLLRKGEGGRGGLTIGERSFSGKEIYDRGLEYGAYGSSLWLEMGDAKRSEQFERFQKVTDAKGLVKAARAMTWLPIKASQAGQAIQDITQFREDLLRAAVYLDALRSVKVFVEQGTPIRHWAGKNLDIQEIAKTDPLRAAARISRETLGDYGDFTPWENETLRNGLAPFYSWMRINTTFWPRVVINAAKEGATGEPLKAAARIIGINALRWLARITAAYGALHLYNNRDEEARRREKALPSYKRVRPHLNLDEGYVGSPTALSDFLEWFGIDRVAPELRRWENGQITGERMLLNVMKTQAQAPVNRVFQALNPFLKSPISALGTRTFPNVFDSTIYAAAFSEKAVATALLEILGADVKRFLDAANGKRTLREVLSYYFSGSSYQHLSTEELTKRIDRQLGFARLKRPSKGRPAGAAKKGRQAEVDELMSRGRAIRGFTENVEERRKEKELEAAARQ